MLQDAWKTEQGPRACQCFCCWQIALVGARRHSTPSAVWRDMYNLKKELRASVTAIGGARIVCKARTEEEASTTREVEVDQGQ